MVLPQDQAQASQASNIIAEREYQSQLAQYEKDKKQYEQELKDYNESQERQKQLESQEKQKQAAAKDDYNKQKAALIWELSGRPGMTGRQLNLAVHEWEAKQRGITKTEFQKIVARDLANEKRARSQSAGLRASGNAQISAAQQTELARLGGGVSPSLSQDSRVQSKVAPSAVGTVAAKAQDFPESFQYRPVEPARPVSPAENFAAIADPNASGFGVAKPQVVVAPLAKDENIRNRISPVLIPVSQRSNIGYGSEGKPIQGPVKQEQRYSVGDRTFKDLATAEKFVERTAKNVITPIGLTDFVNQRQPYKVGEKQFATEKEAQEYINTPRLSGVSQTQYDISQVLDKAAQYKTGNPVTDTIIGHPLGAIRSVVEGVNVLDNLGKYTIPELLGNKPFEGTPIPIQRTGDEVLMPVEISETGVRQKSFGEIKSDSIAYARKYSVGDLMGGALSTYVPIGMGIKAGITIVGKFAAKKLTPKLINTATSEIGSTKTIRKTPAVINPRKPIISKESLYSNIQSTQTKISGTPKLLKPYTPKNPKLGTGVIPKESIKGSIKTSPGFIPNKPTRPYTPLDTKNPVKLDPDYTPARRANEIDYTDSVAFGFTKTKVPLGIGVTKPRPNIFKPKLVKEDPNYSPGIMSGFKETKVKLGVGQAKTPKPKGETYFVDKQFRGFQKSATIIGKIKLSKDFLPSKITPAKPFKFNLGGAVRGKPRKFDEPKIGKGDSLTGKDGSIQIVKSKSEVVKLKKPQSTPVKLISKKETATEQVLKAGSARPIVILTKPAGRILKKKKPVEARTTQSSQVYAPQEYQRVSTSQKNGLSIGALQSSKVIPRLSAKTSPRLAVKISPIISTKQPQAIKQAEVQKFKSPTPEPVRPKLRAAAKFKPKPIQKTVLRQTPPPRPKTRLVAAVIIPLNEKLRKPKGKKSKQFDFLGNTKLDNIEGLFRRSDIIHGDRRISKQVRKDKQAKFKERDVSFFSKR